MAFPNGRQPGTQTGTHVGLTHRHAGGTGRKTSRSTINQGVSAGRRPGVTHIHDSCGRHVGAMWDDPPRSIVNLRAADASPGLER
jgi:hypothetical protein